MFDLILKILAGDNHVDKHAEKPVEDLFISWDDRFCTIQTQTYPQFTHIANDCPARFCGNYPRNSTRSNTTIRFYRDKYSYLLGGSDG